jgi:Pentapeptide repeats (8 copies)
VALILPLGVVALVAAGLALVTSHFLHAVRRIAPPATPRPSDLRSRSEPNPHHIGGWYARPTFARMLKLQELLADWSWGVRGTRPDGSPTKGPFDGVHLDGSDCGYLTLILNDPEGEFLPNYGSDEDYEEALLYVEDRFLEGDPGRFPHVLPSTFRVVPLPLQGAMLDRSNLSYAFLRRASLEGAYLYETDLTRADLSRTHLNAETDFTGARLDRAALDNVVWGDANLSVISWDSMARVAEDVQAATVAEQIRRERSARRVRPLVRFRRIAPPPVRRVIDAAIRYYAGVPPLTGIDLSELFAYRRATLQAAARTNAQLANQLRQQGLSQVADRFAYSARRAELPIFRLTGERGQLMFARALDVVSGFGYRPLNALRWYVATIATFALAYFALRQPTAHEHFGHRAVMAVVLSITAFHGRGLAGAQSLGLGAGAFAALEAVIGLFIEAIFVATFVQRFLQR